MLEWALIQTNAINAWSGLLLGHFFWKIRFFLVPNFPRASLRNIWENLGSRVLPSFFVAYSWTNQTSRVRNVVIHPEFSKRWISIMKTEGKNCLNPGNSPSGPRHQSLLGWSWRTCHSCRSMSARPKGTEFVAICVLFCVTCPNTFQQFKKFTHAKIGPGLFWRILLSALLSHYSRSVRAARTYQSTHPWFNVTVTVIFLTLIFSLTAHGLKWNAKPLPSWVSWRWSLRVTDDWSHRPSPYASRLKKKHGTAEALGVKGAMGTAGCTPRHGFTR